MTEETTNVTAPVEPAPAQQGIQAANAESVAKNDPSMSGLSTGMKLEGAVKEAAPVTDAPAPGAAPQAPVNPPTGQLQSAPAPVAAPKVQIAPVSANGETTSARETPKADAPVNVQVTAGVKDPSASNKEDTPSLPPALNPELPPEAPQVEPQPEVDPEFGKPLKNVLPAEPENPLEEANNFIKMIPGRMRIV